ncbi:MAG: FAD-binding oxidoreductase [Spirochaetales bacterium]|nr:FAD-binding oxidoreductase [Spirochaetales bacterium]
MNHFKTTEGYEEYLKDESRFTGTAESISFPRSEGDIQAVLSELGPEQILTIQGARTGITGGAVPLSGHAMNLSGMKNITGLRFNKEENCFYITVEPGLTLKELRDRVSAGDIPVTGPSAGLFKSQPEHFFPPDPTETGASLGGMAACNASGARSFHYGSVRNYIYGLRLLLADGSLLILKRSVQKASGTRFSLVTEGGREISGELPRYSSPDVKNAAGYFIKPGMDLLDLFIGSEGTLGIITSLELKLIPLPGVIWGGLYFFREPDKALDFIIQAREYALKPQAMEFFDPGSLRLLMEIKKSMNTFSSVPAVDEAMQAACYLEFHGDSEDEVSGRVVYITDIFEGLGGNADDCWLATNPQELTRIIDFRHAVPEAVNLSIDLLKKKNPSLTKLGTDLAVPSRHLKEMYGLYVRDLSRSGLKHVIFGHIGDNHLHVNILPADTGEYEKGRLLYGKWVDKTIECGGTVSAEHGIGKIKKDFLYRMYGEENVASMLALKKIFDPGLRLNRGNLFR